MSTVKGMRPRPRVGLIGKFDNDTMAVFERLFPTLWISEDLAKLKSKVNPIEVDLIIIGPNIHSAESPHVGFLHQAHVICFSNNLVFLPGPYNNSTVSVIRNSTTEHYAISELSLDLYNLLEHDLSSTENAKGWPLIDLQVTYRVFDSIPDSEQAKVIKAGALISDPHTGKPFATIYKQKKSKLGVALLPNSFFSIVPWVELICTGWAKEDRERFPYFGDWTKNIEWMTYKEKSLSSEINRLNLELDKINLDFKARISSISSQLLDVSIAVNKGKRRLITSQGHDLRDEVAKGFSDLGFIVTIIDEEINDKSHKKEDLRIQDTDIKDWEAIVEVRGHTKSSGQPSDFIRVLNFARCYRDEKGKYPNKVIYVVNGQVEIPDPQQRQAPFSAANDEVKAFGEQNGLVIWTIDLYKVFTFQLTDEDRSEIRKTIRENIGMWSYTPK